MKQALNWLIRDKNGRIAIWQNPNLPLWTWLVAKSVSYMTYGIWHEIISSLALGALIAWSSMELLRGVSNFRRLLGLVVLIFCLRSLFL